MFYLRVSWNLHVKQLVSINYMEAQLCALNVGPVVMAHAVCPP